MIFPEMHMIRHLTPTCIPIPRQFELKYLLDKGVIFLDFENIDKISKILEKSRVANNMKMADVILPDGWGIHRVSGFIDKDGKPDIYGSKYAYICDAHGNVVVKIWWDWKFSTENFTCISPLRYGGSEIMAPLPSEKFTGKRIDGWICYD